MRKSVKRRGSRNRVYRKTRVIRSNRHNRKTRTARKTRRGGKRQARLPINVILTYMTTLLDEIDDAQRQAQKAFATEQVNLDKMVETFTIKNPQYATHFAGEADNQIKLADINQELALELVAKYDLIYNNLSDEEKTIVDAEKKKINDAQFKAAKNRTP